MSHFLLAVFHDECQDVDDMLAPYDEELKTETHIEFTKEQAIRFARENFKDYRDKPDEECWKLMADGCTTDENGNIFSTDNPQAKWDWYEIGGRWDGYLRVNGEHVNSARIGEIDFGSDEQKAEFSTYAVITPDGRWHEYSPMGWGGLVHGNKEDSKDWYAHYWERFIMNSDPNTMITIVDCHI